MKYMKMLGLLGMSAVSLWCFAGSAAAGSFTVSHTVATPKLEATATDVVLHGPLNITCSSSTLDVEITTHGSNVTAKGPSELFLMNCGDDTFHIIKGGTVEFHTHPNDASGGSGNATITSSGMEMTAIADTIFGNVHCVYSTSSSDIGTFRGAPSTTGHATIEMGGTIPRTGGSFLCGSSGEITGTYEVDTPTGLRYH